MLPYIVPARPPTRSWPVIVELSPTFWIVAPLAYPKRPTLSIAGRLIYKPLMVWLRPSKTPVKGVARVPTGRKPAPLYHPEVVLASMLLARTYHLPSIPVLPMPCTP